MEEQKQFYEQQLGRLSHEVQTHSSEKEGLKSKMKKVYERTQERMTDDESKKGYLDLFNEVMQEREALGELTNENASNQWIMIMHLPHIQILNNIINMLMT